MRRILFLATVVAFSLVSCTKSSSNGDVTPNLGVTDSILVNASATSGAFTLFSFADTAEIANTDSATADWDFAMRSTVMLVNSMSSGPGNASAQLFDGDYATLTSYPTTGYVKDSTTTNRAIKVGTWYDYNQTTNVFTPKAGKMFLFKTADLQKNVKMQILKVDPKALVNNRPTKYLYTFRYVIQP